MSYYQYRNVVLCGLYSFRHLAATRPRPMRYSKTILLIGLLSLVVPIAADEIEVLVNESRGAVQAFKQSLQAELQAHLKTGGPVQAISVCNVRAPEIAASLSKPHDWHIGRTSLKLRNPNNAPDDWERAVLEQFEHDKSGGADPQSLEHYAVVSEEGRRYFRYMKAIPVGEVCLACHGASIAPDVRAKLNELYPNDQATGFSVGDLRGAFTISQSLDTASN